MPSAPPPPPAPEGIQPQRRGQTRSALHDPAQLAVNFRSSGWRKDLEHILWVTTDTASTTLWRQTGQGSRSSFLTTCSSTRRNPWSLRRPIHWTLWPISRTSFTRPPVSTWMASAASPIGSKRGAIIMG